MTRKPLVTSFRKKITLDTRCKLKIIFSGTTVLFVSSGFFVTDCLVFEQNRTVKFDEVRFVSNLFDNLTHKEFRVRFYLIAEIKRIQSND